MNTRRTVRGVAGLTLIEIMIAVTILVLALLGLFGVILHTTRINSSQRENLAAMRAAEQKIEEMMAYTFNDIFEHFGPNNPPGTPGNTFDITLNTLEYYDAGSSTYKTNNLNLEPVGNTPVGQITFPTVNSNPAGDLDERETGSFTKMGANLDLDGNGSTTDVFTVLDMPSVNILPVQIDLTWTGIKGRQTMTYRHILMRR